VVVLALTGAVEPVDGAVGAEAVVVPELGVAALEAGCWL
jgi:hypothetical protein